MEELGKAEDATYKSSLVAFTNHILQATEDIQERIKLRNELTGKEKQDLTGKDI